MDLTKFLKELISLPGLSGYEGPVRDVISRTWEPLVDELTTSRLGSLYGLKRGKGAEPRPRILISAHMDAIGLMATQVVDGFIRFTEVGGVDPRILPGQPVLVHGRQTLPGIVVQPPAFTLPPEKQSGAVPMAYLLVDVGLPAAEVAQLVRPGDLISFDQQPMDLSGDTLAGHTMDNRASVTALTACLDELQHMAHNWDVLAVASVQEEETLGGAITASYELRPDLAIAVDVTFAKGPGSSDWRAFPLGKGVAIGFGPNIHPFLFNEFKSLAEKLDIPYHVDVMPSMSGTDAMGLQVAREGVPTIVLSIPQRYMHTPVELVSMKDIARVGHLMAEFIARLEPDFVSKIKWEDEQS